MMKDHRSFSFVLPIVVVTDKTIKAIGELI